MSFKDLFKSNKEKSNTVEEAIPKEDTAIKDNDVSPNEETSSWIDALESIGSSRLFKLFNEYNKAHGINILDSNEYINYILLEANKDGIFLSSDKKRQFLTSCISKLNDELNEFFRKKEELIEEAKEKAKNELINDDNTYTDEELNTKIEEKIQPELENLNNIDAGYYTFITEDDMVAYILITPPIGNGLPMDREALEKALNDSDIKYGIDEEKKELILNEKCYGRFIRIAKGTKAISGEDGEITHHFQTTDKINLVEDSKGQVDYKNLGRFHPIKKDDVICDIKKAIKGTDGMTVKNKVIKAYNGKEITIPKGDGIGLTEDGLQVVAKIDGYLTYINGVYTVKPKMIIEGNVDASTGNIIFNGDVEVKGDVTSGYKIEVTGDIKVFGVVEGSSLKAGGNISIKHGVNGNNQAVLEAGGDIKSLFFENCKAYAKGGIYSETIVQSDINSDGIVDCLRGKGVIIGGTINSVGSVMANIVGNKSGKLTTINIGQSHSRTSRLNELSIVVGEDQKIYEKLSKNVDFLEAQEELPAPKKALYDSLVEQKNAYAEKLKVELTELNELKNQNIDLSNCRLETKKLYAPLLLNIGNASKMIKDNSSGSIYQYDKETAEIVIGSL